MLTEDEVRDLLRQAGETIDVDPTNPAHVVAGRRRPWLYAAAAGSIAAVLVLVFALAGGIDRSSTRDDGPDPATPADGDAFVLEDDQVPSVFGMPAEVAREMLEDKGLTVEVQFKGDCGETPGRALATAPATGTPFEPGDEVALTVSRIPPNVRCPQREDRAIAWQLIDLANGWGRGPVLASEITTYVDGGPPTALAADEAADPDAWGEPSAMSELRNAVDWVRPLKVHQRAEQHTRYDTPELAIARDLTDQDAENDGNACGGTPEPTEPGPADFSIVIDIPKDGQDLHCALRIDVFREGPWVSALSTFTRKDRRSATEATIEVPDVVGIPTDEATRVLEQAGFDVVIQQPATCTDPWGFVSEQQPVATSSTPAGSRVTITDPRSPEGMCAGWGTPSALAATQQLARFARGADDDPPLGWTRCVAAERCDPELLSFVRDSGSGLALHSSIECAIAHQNATILAGSRDECSGTLGYLTAGTDGVTSAGFVGSAPERTPIPQVVGLARDEAVSLLEEAGFRVNTRMTNPTGCDESRVVIDQTPNSGREGLIGRSIILRVSRMTDPDCH